MRIRGDRRGTLATTLRRLNAPDDLIAGARSGDIKLEALAAFEEGSGLVAGITLVAGAAYVDRSFSSDGYIALARDPKLDAANRCLLLAEYEEAVRRSESCSSRQRSELPG